MDPLHLIFVLWPNKLDYHFLVSPFELLHIDLWGPHPVASVTGAKNFLTIVDEFSRATWTNMSQHKSQTPSLLKTFFQMIANQFQTTVKTIQNNLGFLYKIFSCFQKYVFKNSKINIFFIF